FHDDDMEGLPRKLSHDNSWKEDEATLANVVKDILGSLNSIWMNPAFDAEFASDQSEGTYVTDVIVPLIRATLNKLPIKKYAFLSRSERLKKLSSSSNITVTTPEHPSMDGNNILPPSVCSELPVIYQREINITSATSNLSEIEKSSESASSICTETKLLEDREKISNEIRERNRENRFRSQDPLSYDKDISQSNKNKVQKFMSEVSGSSSPQLNRDVTSATSNETKFQPSNTNFTLLYEKLCDAIILADRKTQEAIMCYYLFGKALIQRRNEIASEQQVDPESNIVSRILNKEVKAQLPADTSDSLLRKRIEKAKKLYRLFDAIGMDKIYRIHSFSADSISKLTKKEIQYIIDNVSFDYSIQIELHSDEKNPEHMTQLCEP
ncbi:12463_t:CDS:2, partial [Racocetra fulgida]